MKSSYQDEGINKTKETILVNRVLYEFNLTRLKGMTHFLNGLLKLLKRQGTNQQLGHHLESLTSGLQTILDELKALHKQGCEQRQKEKEYRLGRIALLPKK